MSKLKVKLLKDNAKLPTRAHKTDAGYDLYAIKGGTIYPHDAKTFELGISIELPEGTYGRISDRSSMAINKGLHVLAGVIDKGYTGELTVTLFNTKRITVDFKPGDKIAQLIVEKIENCEIEEVKSHTSSERGSKGHGSTGA